MLKAVNNDTAGKGYCGPTAVASITGKPLSKVLDAFRAARYGENWKANFRATGQRTPPIRGTSAGEVHRALRTLGWEIREAHVRHKDGESRVCSDAQAVWFGSPGKNPEGKTEWRVDGQSRPTLAQWLRERGPAQMAATYLVNVSHHWVAVSGRKLCDTYTKGEPVFIRKAPHRRKRVKAVYLVTRLA